MKVKSTPEEIMSFRSTEILITDLSGTAVYIRIRSYMYNKKYIKIMCIIIILI